MSTFAGNGGSRLCGRRPGCNNRRAQQLLCRCRRRLGQRLHRRHRQLRGPQSGQAGPSQPSRNYTQGLSGDGGAATSAQLARPAALAFDSDGNLYIADQSNSASAKVTPGGVISDLRRNHVWELRRRRSSDISSNGGSRRRGGGRFGQRLYRDAGTHAIRKVDGGGKISTVANQAVRQIAIGPGNRLITASDFSNQVSVLTNERRIPVAGTGVSGGTGDGGPSTAAQLYYPVGCRCRLDRKHLYRRFSQPKDPAGAGFRSFLRRPFL